MIKGGILKEDTVEEVDAQKKGFALAFLGWLFTFLSLMSLPIVFSPLGVIFGFMSKKVEGRDIQGPVIMIAAVACGVIGMYLGLLNAADKL